MTIDEEPLHPNLVPPYFKDELKSWNLNPGNLTVYMLPNAIDDDGNDVNITVTLKNSTNFVSYFKKKFIFNPENEDIGFYLIMINLTDTGTPPRLLYTFSTSQSTITAYHNHLHYRQMSSRSSLRNLRPKSN